MIPALKSEFRKLLTVRSTYIVTLLVAAFVTLIAFYFEGWKLNSGQLLDPTQLAGDVTGALNVTIIGGIVAILLMSHEYRYNTIMYTLTSSNSRSKVLLAKFLVVSLYALFLAALIGMLSPLMSYFGVHAHGHTFGPQTLHYGELAWRSLFYGWGYGMAGLLLALLTRSQVAAIVSLFMLPFVAEQTLGFFVFKHNAVYLPFHALTQVLNGGSSTAGDPTSSTMSAGKAAGVYCIYLAVGWIVAWILFLRRDAN